MPRERIPELYADFVQFEKKHGDRQAIEVRHIFVRWRLKPTSHLTSLPLPYLSLHTQKTNKQDVVVGKRRAQYEEALSSDPLDYDTWFDYARLEEAQARRLCLLLTD